MNGGRSLGAQPSRTKANALPAVVIAPKSGSAYQAHSYPTKVPPAAITPFIEASTEPGAIVLDPFCGSGMTGVAAIQSGRCSILSDLSHGAVHLALNHTQRVEPDRLLAGLAGLEKNWMQDREADLYATGCPTCGGPGMTRHTIWSDVLTCEMCRQEVVLWAIARDNDGHVPRTVRCPACRTSIKRAGAVPARSIPAEVTVHCLAGCATLQRGDLSREARGHLSGLAARPLLDWIPDNPVEPEREMYRRSALHLRGIETVADFYLPRAKLALAELWRRIGEVREATIRNALRFAFTNTAWHASRMRRYNARGGQRPLTGTLYIPQLVAEANVFEVFRHQVEQVAGFYRALHPSHGVRTDVRRSSATDLSWIPDGTVDYVFTDPPFGSNIFYADCNIVWESWLGATTDTEQEIVVNKSRSPQDGGKSVEDYCNLLGEAFAEIRRVVRPTGRASVVFHNSNDQVWSALLAAAERAGFRQEDVSMIDKVQRSMKGYRGRAGTELVPFYDLVITFSPGKPVRPHLNGAGEIAVDAVRTHLLGADHRGVPTRSHLRSLEYLYSLAVGSIVRLGARPDGLSFHAFEGLCRNHFATDGRHFTLL